MKILHVTAQKPDSTGSGVYLNQLVTSLAKLGHQQAVVCGIDREDQSVLAPGVAVYPVRFRTPSLPFPVCGMSDEMPYESTRYRDMTDEMEVQFRAAFENELKRAIAELQPDAIVCNHLYLVTALVRQIAPATKVFAICHSTCLRQLRSHGLARDFIMDGVRSLDGIFALHDQQKQQVIELFDVPESLVHVIGTGYDSSVFNAPDESVRPTDVVYVGKISFAKGVASLVRALSGLPESMDPLQVHLVGGAGNREEHAEIVRLAQASRHDILLLGKVSQERLVQEYQTSKLFVLPSFYEGLPLVTIEAMACGCNVVVSDLPGVRPWLSSNIQDAPVEYVTLPRIEGVDTPVAEDLPAYEQRLADAIQRFLLRPAFQGSVSHLSWDSLAQRVASLVQK